MTDHTEIPHRVVAALEGYGFDVARLSLQRLGSVVRVGLPQGAALGARLAAAAIAVRAAGFGCDVHPEQAAIVAYPSALEVASAVEPVEVCPTCARGRCVRHAPLFAELEA